MSPFKSLLQPRLKSLLSSNSANTEYLRILSSSEDDKYEGETTSDSSKYKDGPFLCWMLRFCWLGFNQEDRRPAGLPFKAVPPKLALNSRVGLVVLGSKTDFLRRFRDQSRLSEEIDDENSELEENATLETDVRDDEIEGSDKDIGIGLSGLGLNSSASSSQSPNLTHLLL